MVKVPLISKSSPPCGLGIERSNFVSSLTSVETGRPVYRIETPNEAEAA